MTVIILHLYVSIRGAWLIQILLSRCLLATCWGYWLTSSGLVCQVFVGVKPWALRLVSLVGCAHLSGCWLRLEGSYRIYSWVTLSGFYRHLQIACWKPDKCQMWVNFSLWIWMSRVASATEAWDFCGEGNDRLSRTNYHLLFFLMALFSIWDHFLMYEPSQQNEINDLPDKGVWSVVI